MLIRLLLAPLCAAMGIAPPADPAATVDTTATRLDASGNPMPDDGPGQSGDGQQMPPPGPFMIPDGQGGMIYGCRIPAGKSPDTIIPDNGGARKLYNFPAGAGPRASTFTVRENSGGGAESYAVEYATGV